jgi:Lsr2
MLAFATPGGYSSPRLLTSESPPVSLVRSRTIGVSQAKEGVMAQRVEVILEDDIDGSPAAETVQFALNGTSYEIDLSNENAQALRGALGRYVEHARKASGGPRQARGPRKRADTSAVREWARAQGKEISDRGRIPASVMKEYQAAQGS